MRPSTEQWRQLHGMSREIYGQPLAIWDHHDQPETREEASDLIRQLVADERVDEEETMEETRVCAECDVEKPLDRFRKWARGHRKECKACEAPEVQTDTTPVPKDVQGTDGLGNPVGPSTGATQPESLAKAFKVGGPVDFVPFKGEHWCLAELRDPRLSVVRQAQKILDAKGLIDVSIEDTAEILGEIASLDLA